MTRDSDEGPFLLLTTFPLDAHKSHQDFAKEEWERFLQTRSETLSNTELRETQVGKNPFWSADFHEKENGKEWAGRIWITVHPHKKLGYVFIMNAAPPEFANLSRLFENVLSSLKLGNWRHIDTIVLRGSNLSLDALGETTLLSIGTYHGIAETWLSPEDIRDLLKALSSPKLSSFAPKQANGSSHRDQFKWERDQGSKSTLFLEEQGGIVKGGRTELSMLDAKSSSALKAALKKLIH